MKIFLTNGLILTFFANFVYCVNLVTYISQHGLHGEIRFKQFNTTFVEVSANLETTLQYPDQIWSWGVYEFPVDYAEVDGNKRCDLSNLGKSFISFDEDLGYLTLPGNETSKWYKEMTITGEHGIWGKSLVIFDNRARICATITTEDTFVEHIAEAKFYSPIAGSVYFRWLASTYTSHRDTMIFADLFHIQKLSINESFTHHHWKIYVTDILKNDHHRHEENCNFLQQVFDPDGQGEGKSTGDLDNRLGKLTLSTNALKEKSRVVFRDSKLVLQPSDLSIPHRTLYLVLFDPYHTTNFLACAQIRQIPPVLYKTIINSHGINGELTLKQRSKFDPTFLNFTIASSSKTHADDKMYAEDVSLFQIKSLPPNPLRNGHNNFCETTGTLYNPTELDLSTVPPLGYGTQDQYAIGDLSGKLQNRNKQYFHNYILPGKSGELNGIYWDAFLPLQGPNSIAHRSLVIYKYNRTNIHKITSEPWACGTILQYTKKGIYQKQMSTAQILFRYPIVGRILLRQSKDEPWQDTIVIVEYLIHADGSTENSSEGHRWAIHDEPPGKDFYDWQNRCISTGGIYNPFNVNWVDKDSFDSYCRSGISYMCRLGDTFNRLGKLAIAGSRHDAANLTRKLFIDTNLPLSGRFSIIGKSLTIYDDQGPKARGERLACSIITGHSRRKVVAKDWHPNGVPFKFTGKLEVTQQSEYDISNVEVEFKGLENNGGYHIHQTPIEANLEFPCEDSTLYGHFNPFSIDSKHSPLPKNGSVDQYEIGDLSGKFGTLDGLTHFEESYNDTNLPLFGYNNILGRSIVIHKKKESSRWACSTIERGYSPSEAREIRAIASFHNPLGYAFGYMRMTQLIHNDGGLSDTVIEIKLRHPGEHDRNMTFNHKWQIFVNPIGVDATVKQTITRCVAGGYVWNPYYTQLADPLNSELYERECAPDNPLRCYVGDVSARIGTINIGDKRVVLTDSNFPLEGPVSAVGRSIVIFGPNWSSDRYACANIEPDHNIVKYINIQKPPRFVIAQFLEDIRKVMGVPEWMMDIDARKTKILHNGACIQMIIHFKGPQAHHLEQEFSRLLANGRLDAPSLFIPGYVDIKRKSAVSYKTCGVRDPNEKFKSSSRKRLHFSSSSSCLLQPKAVLSSLSLVAFVLFAVKRITLL